MMYNTGNPERRTIITDFETIEKLPPPTRQPGLRAVLIRDYVAPVTVHRWLPGDFDARDLHRRSGRELRRYVGIHRPAKGRKSVLATRWAILIREIDADQKSRDEAARAARNAAFEAKHGVGTKWALSKDGKYVVFRGDVRIVDPVDGFPALARFEFTGGDGSLNFPTIAELQLSLPKGPDADEYSITTGTSYTPGDPTVDLPEPSPLAREAFDDKIFAEESDDDAREPWSPFDADGKIRGDLADEGFHMLGALREDCQHLRTDDLPIYEERFAPGSNWPRPELYGTKTKCLDCGEML